MSLRRLIVEVDVGEVNVREFCREHGVSTWTFYELRRRFAVEGLAGLEPRSRAPRTVANRTPGVVEDVIVSLRKELASQGLDAGPATIVFHLPALLGPGVQVPSEATVWRVLTRRGFIVPDPTKTPGHAWRSFAAERVNERWQIDDTRWVLADGTEVKIINVVDDCSRVAVSSQAVATCTTETALEAVMAGATQWGLPARFLSDNASVFRFGLTEALGAMGIAAGHSRPYHPQTCGKVERFHQTLKRFLDAQPPADSLLELQHQLDSFTSIYNHHRPHRALGRRRPAEVFATTAKSGPASHALGAVTTIHRATVNGGTMAAGSRYVISLGAAYTGQVATAVITGRACHVFIDGQLVRHLTLNPHRRNQPLYPQPGRPPTLKPQP